MRALALAAAVAVAVAVCSGSLPARAVHKKTSDFDPQFQTVILDGAQLGKLHVGVTFSPFQKHSLFRQRTENTRVACDFERLRFECVRLTKSITTPDGLRVKYLFASPVPYIAVINDLIGQPDMPPCLTGKEEACDSGPHFGAAVKITRHLVVPKLEADPPENKVFGEIDPETYWTSYEKINNSPSGQESLSFLRSLIGKPPSKDCNFDQCSRFYSFTSQFRKISEGIASCSVYTDPGVATFPRKNTCWALAVKSGDDWFILSVISPEIISEIGAGAGGLYCDAPRSIDPVVMRKAFMAVASTPPIDLEMREGTTRGSETVVVGHKSGMQSAILQKVGFGKYFETATFHGTVNSDENNTYLHGDLTIMVHRRSGTGEPFYELNDNESDAYFREFRRQLALALSKKLNAEIVCRDE